MQNFIENHETKIQLLEFLVNPPIPVSGKRMRARGAPTKIKILYHIFQLHKNRWVDIYQSQKTICKSCKVSRKHLSEFLNSDEFSLFGDLKHRPGTSSIVCLKKWVLGVFSFLERKGMMKFFRSDFKKWKSIFLKRLRNWLLPLLRSGKTLNEILTNKLSTEKILKGDNLKTLKGGTIKYTSSSYKALQGSKSKPKTSYPKCVEELVSVCGSLKDRFLLKESDIYMVTKSFNLNHLKRAINLGEIWLKNGMKVDSPIKMYQSCLNKTRRNHAYKFGC